MNVMESLLKLFKGWEIQLLVLVSFTIQLFLFLTGSLRRHSTSGFLRLCIWAAYLGADLIAVYALGVLSRHEDITIDRHASQPLVFFWAPFLLIHLGGQDTITAYAMEDNNLWLRHLLNLVMQVVSALYVFWMSIGRHNVELLVSGILAFVAGIIKYGERIWCLECACLKTLESSTGQHYKKLLPKEINGDGYDSIVCEALGSMRYVLDMFSGRSLLVENSLSRLSTLGDPNKMLKVVRIELGVMYDDLYTKALVIRTRSVMIFRCISQISAVVAFVLFYTDDKQGYNKGDIAVTYSLFIGGFFLEVCSMFIYMLSPWTWAWLKVHKCGMLASLSWYIFSSDIGWPEEKQRWPKSMGQYNFVRWLADMQPETFSQRVMTMVRRLIVDLFGVKKESLFWMSKMVETEQVDVDKMLLQCVSEEISLLHDELGMEGQVNYKRRYREWPKLGALLGRLRGDFVSDFGFGIVWIHALTEAHLSKYSPSDVEANDAEEASLVSGMLEVCKKLSNYMMYLLVTHPAMLPLAACAVATLENYHLDPQKDEHGMSREELLFEYGLQPSKETLKEMVSLWTRLLIYSAGRSRAEMHAARLSSGGELITFVWLLMAHRGLGDSLGRRIEITNQETISGWDVFPRYAFYYPETTGCRVEEISGGAPSSAAPGSAGWDWGNTWARPLEH